MGAEFALDDGCNDDSMVLGKRRVMLMKQKSIFKSLPGEMHPRKLVKACSNGMPQFDHKQSDSEKSIGSPMIDSCT